MEEKKIYQLNCLLQPDLPKLMFEEVEKEIRKIIEASGGIIEKSNFYPKKDLAYFIINKKLAMGRKKYNTAAMLVIDFQISPEKIAVLEKFLQKETKIMRHILLAQKKTKKSVVEEKEEVEKEDYKKVSEKTNENKPSEKIKLKEIDKKLNEILNEQ